MISVGDDKAVSLTAPERSPFRMVAGAQQVWLTPKVAPPSAGYLLDLVRRNQITPRDLNIVETVYRGKFFTANQLYRLFFPNLLARSQAKNTLKRLLNMQLLSAFSWDAPGWQSGATPRIFALDEGGMILLRHYRGIPGMNFHASYAVKSMDYIFKILVANELFVRFVEQAPPAGLGNSEFRVEPLLPLPKAPEKKLIPTAYFDYYTPRGPLNFIVESIRGANGIEHLVSKGRRLRDFLEQSPGVRLLILVEDVPQAQSVHWAMKANGISIEPLYVTDSALLNKPLESSSFAFVYSADQPYEAGKLFSYR